MLHKKTKLSAETGRRTVGVWLPDSIAFQAAVYNFNSQSGTSMMVFIEQCMVEFLKIVDFQNMPERYRAELKAPSETLRKKAQENGLKLNAICMKELFKEGSIQQKVPRLDEDVWFRAKFASIIMRVNGVGPIGRIAVLWYLYEHDYEHLPEFLQIKPDTVVIPQTQQQEMHPVGVGLPKCIINQIRNYQPEETKGRKVTSLLSFITRSVEEYMLHVSYEHCPRRLKAEYPEPAAKTQEDNGMLAARLFAICAERFSGEMTQKTPSLPHDLWDACIRLSASSGYEGAAPIVRMAVLWSLYRKDYDNLPECFRLRNNT